MIFMDATFPDLIFGKMIGRPIQQRYIQRDAAQGEPMSNEFRNFS